jgi:hypothetical protein
MIHNRFPVSTLIVLIIVAGCSVFPGNPPPTFIPEEKLPTVIELTSQALVDQGLVTPPPSQTLSPAQLTGTAAPTSTLTFTPEPSYSPTPTLDVVLGTPEPLTLPDPLPQAEIQIINPGRLSRVKSPIKLHLFLAPSQTEKGEELSYQVRLYGGNGRLLIQESFIADDGDEDSSHQVMDIEFVTAGSAESARLEISSIDGYGRIKALATTDLVLLSDGEEEIKAIQDLFDTLIIQQPIPSTLIQGDILVIQGLTRSAPGDQLVVELINRDGGQVGSGIVPVSQEELGYGYRLFAGEIPYQVGSSSWIRVQVIARDGNFSGVQYLSSVEVLVSP